MKKLAIGLIRVSSTKQGLIGDSTDKQKEEIEKILVPKYNAPVDQWISLIQSASGEIQPATKAIEYCKSHPEISYCYITYIDRFTRAGSYYYQHLKAQLAKYGVQLLDLGGVISNEYVNTLESFGKEYKWSVYSPSLKAEILEAEDSRDEIRRILTRLIGSEIRYLRMGYWASYAPEGYIVEKIETENGKRCILSLDPEKSKYILRMYELRIEGVSDDEIIGRINAMGYKTKRLHIRDSKGVVTGYKGEKPLTTKRLNRILANPIYCLISTHTWLDKPTAMHGTPIVTIEMFNKANKGKILIVNENNEIKILKGKVAERYTRKSKNVPQYAYKEYVMCPLCNGKFKGSASKGKLGKYYAAYHCSKNHKYLRVSTDNMMTTIEEYIKKVEFTDEFKAKFRQITIEELEKRIDHIATDSLNIEQTVADLKAEKKLIIDKIKSLSSPIALRAMEEELEAIEAKLVSATQKRDNQEDQQLDLELLLNHCKYYVEHLEDLLLGGSDPIQNAAFFGLVFDVAPTYEDLKSGTPQLAPLFKLNGVFRQGINPNCEPSYPKVEHLYAHFSRIHETFQRFNYVI